MKAIVLKYALQNAVKFEGKANEKAVLGSVLGKEPELRKDMIILQNEIKESVSEVNKLSFEEQKKQLEELAPELLLKEKPVKKDPLKPLKNAVPGSVVMRFAPSPSGPLHIGHAYVLNLNSEYCRLYNGKLILRIEDTNPEKIYDKSYEFIPEDANWITKNNISQVVVQSDRLGIYYNHAEKLVTKGHAYVCDCDPEKFRELIKEKKPCPCRGLSAEEQHKRYLKMFSDYKQGEVVLRLKTEIDHKNPAMRDFPLMRINESEHPRQGKKFRVWPLMNLAVAVDDHELNVTHTIRAKDHMDNEKRQKYIFDYLGWKTPEHVYVGVINFTDLKISCSETKKEIDEGKYSDWDDIRLPFLRALKRRGYQPEAFIKYSLDVGVTQNDKKVSSEEFFQSINAFNKEIIESMANRYFFISDPYEIEVKGAHKQTCELELHPNDPTRGKRVINTSSKFIIERDDFKKMKHGDMFRLMNCLNFKRNEKDFHFDSLDYDKFKKKGKGIIHWLPNEIGLIKVSVTMPDGSTLSGLGEKALGRVMVNSIIQFERFGFCRLDKIDKNGVLEFWFLHK